MDGLTLKIIKGNRKALALAKTLITTPTLINVDPRQGALYAIPLDAETNQQRASAEVSESLIIAMDTKKFISDNVAPGSKSWQLSGYIKGIPRLEPTNYFQPYVMLHTQILWGWFNKGAVLWFKDGDSKIYPRVVIKDLQTAQQKDSANATPFTMTLKEINVMDTTALNFADNATGDVNKLKKSIPAIGSALGAPADLGVTAAETIEQTA
jgi:hypothetical protein